METAGVDVFFKTFGQEWRDMVVTYEENRIESIFFYAERSGRQDRDKGNNKTYPEEQEQSAAQTSGLSLKREGLTSKC